MPSNKKLSQEDTRRKGTPTLRASDKYTFISFLLFPFFSRSAHRDIIYYISGSKHHPILASIPARVA